MGIRDFDLLLGELEEIIRDTEFEAASHREFVSDCEPASAAVQAAVRAAVASGVAIGIARARALLLAQAHDRPPE